VASSEVLTTETFSERVTDRSRDLAPAERRVADGLLDLGLDAALLSASALAERLGTSDATVVRTAKSLGYAGLAEMRRALAAGASNPPPGERLRRTLNQTPREQIFTAAVGQQLTALDALARNVAVDEFDRAAEVLSDADRILWRGVGPSAHLAAYAQVLTQRIGKASNTLVHTGTSFADELLGVRDGDAVVVFAYGRLQSHLRVLVEHATSLDIPIVLVTDTLRGRLGDQVHTTLECGRGVPGLFASHGTTLVVIEALVLAVAASDRTASAQSLSTLNELRAELVGRRLDVDTP
jgi:DNA-binding MurR/RpiR family transcriptional regulator